MTLPTNSLFNGGFRSILDIFSQINLVKEGEREMEEGRDRGVRRETGRETGNMREAGREAGRDGMR